MKLVRLLRTPAVAITGIVLLASVLLGVSAAGQSKRDPHRPRCADARCRRIETYLRAHYCGKSPFGNGPDDGCEIKRPNKAEQQPSPAVHGIVLSELHRLGLPTNDDNDVHVVIWKAPDWSVAQGMFTRTDGSDLRLCEVLVAIDSQSHVTVLRTVRFQKTDADVPTVTTWSVVDIAVVDGNKSPDIILEGDAYENHWLEVESLHGSSWKKVFSGLGYYL